MKPEDICTKLRKLESDRETINEIWDQIVRYIAPYRGRFFKDEQSENSIEWRQPWVYDGTAIMASQSLAAHLHSRLTSPSFRWFGLRFRSDELNASREAGEWADECSTRIFNALQDSNFNVEAAECYQDLVDFGTAVIYEEEDDYEESDKWKGLDFTAIPVKEIFFEEDSKEQLYNFYRRVEMTPIQLFDKFGDACPQWLIDNANDPEFPPDQKEIVIFAVWRRGHIDKDEIDLGKPLSPEMRPYGYRWILLKDASPVSDEGGYYEMPAFVPRWRTTSSSMWGNSPAMIALSDVLSLNRLVELHIQSVEKVIDPPTITTERGLIGDLDLNPAGLTVVRDINEMKPYESGARFDVNYNEITRFRDQIREYFMMDQLQLPKMEGTPATATEISTRVSQLEKLIAPTLGRLITDFLDPCISRTFNIMYRAGQLPEMPQIVAEAGDDMDIEYVGALARSLQQDQVDGVDRWLMQISQAAQLNPEVLDIPDWDAMFKGSGKMLGVPAKFIRSDDDIKADREARKKTAGQAQEAQLMEQAGKGMEAIGKGEQAMSDAQAMPASSQPQGAL